MQVSVETTQGLERRMTIGVPKEHLEPKVKTRLKSLARQTKINGFRPGKVPMKVVEQRYGQKVRQEVFGEILNSSFNDAIIQEKLQPIGTPTFDVISDIQQLEQGLSYTATFEIYPEISTLQVDGLRIEKPVAQITETDIDTMIERLCQQRQTWSEVEREAKLADRVMIDADTKKSKTLQGNEFKQIPIIIGQPNVLLPGIEQQLEGSRAGEERQFDLTFPDNYPNPDYAGQLIHLTIQVHSVAEPLLPEIDEDFVKSFGVENGDIETLRQDARSNMERELAYAQNRKLKNQVLDALVAANPLDVPQALVEEETQRLLKNQQEGRGQPQLSTEALKEHALNRVKIGILVGELIKKYQIQAPPDQVQQMVERISFAYEDPEAVKRAYYDNAERMKEVESMVLEEQVVQWLLQKAQIAENNSDFYTVMEKIE